jgi:hypothetical protein
MATNKQPIALGIASHGVAPYGDGVPGTVFDSLPNPLKNAVTFNFSDPAEVKIELEGSSAPLYVGFKKDATDYIEMSIPTPSNDVIKKLMGGEIDATKDVWKSPVNGVPDISYTYKCETEARNGMKVIYTITNAKVMAKLSQGPTADNPELLMVRFYIQDAISAAGVKGAAFTREVVTVTV